MDRRNPSRLHATENLPHFMLFNALLATSSAFITAPEAAASIIALVSCGFPLLSTSLVKASFENIISVYTIAVLLQS